MSKFAGGFHRTSKHRRQNFSMDIKNIYAATPLRKNSLKQKLSLNIKQHLTCNISMQVHNQARKGSKRRLSLTKTTKASNLGNQQCYFYNDKIKKVQRMINQEKYAEATPIIRQMFSKDQNCNSKNKLLLLYAQCLFQTHKLKQAEQYFSKYLANQPNNYNALIKRGKIRYQIGAKELSIRDLTNALYLEPKKPQAYLVISYYHSELNNIKQSINILLKAINNGITMNQVLIKATQLICSNSNTFNDSKQKIVFIESIFENAKKFNKTNDSQLQCFYGLVNQFKHKNQAYIFFQQCLKYNTSRYAVTIAVEHLLIKKIQQRDYYAAYHLISRLKILSIDQKYLQSYVVFLDGVVLVMKKKYSDGIKILQKLLDTVIGSKNYLKVNCMQVCSKIRLILQPLLYKFLAFACFKLGKHQFTISYYQKLQVFGHDQCSSYNLLLAEGIVAIQKKKNFQLGIQKFQHSKYIYPNKSQPYIYISMTILYRQIFISNKKAQNTSKEDLISATVHAIQEMNEGYQNCGNNSSNLLFHRALLHLFLGEIQQGIDDINQCIQKAEQNQPKYFYVRGLCYSMIRQLRKAINQFSISLSLSQSYHQSLLERAKCFFLLGQTQNGFNDLKTYMHSHPDDYQVHKWIGDLLYEGYSYNDALKAYEEIQCGLSYQAELMKIKCLFRTGSVQNLIDSFNKISKMQQCDPISYKVDMIALNILRLISKSGEKKDIAKRIKQLNAQLQNNRIGTVFELIDCMNLLGLASLHIGNYQQAYQSFLLSIELFPSYSSNKQNQLKSQLSQQNYSLFLHDLYLNCIVALLGMKNYSQASRILIQQFIDEIPSQRFIKYIIQLVNMAQSDEKKPQKKILQSCYKKNQKISLKTIQLNLRSIKLKCTPNFSLFHKSTTQLYADVVIDKIVRRLHPSYIDNMPEGPWIKRNQYGVIFTDNIVQSEIGSSLISSMRDQKPKKKSVQSVSYNYQSDEMSQCQQEQMRRKEFMKNMALDPKIQKKLNSIISKGDKNSFRSR